MSSFFLPAAAAALLLATGTNAQVTAAGTNGVTNPAQPSMGAYNQTSDSRLLSLNSVDDFCLYAPATPGDTIGNQEGEVVAWCTKPRNNARLIPDGVITSAHFVKTPLYVQITGTGDLTKLNIQQGDEGGELDPHGATGLGNPVGGNVTSNVTGSDVFYEEWMSYVSYADFCLRICTAENSTYSAALECQHTIDLLGCRWVMPDAGLANEFTSCDADSAYPPGVYPLEGGGTSTFAQRYTNTAVGNEFTIGVTVTPSAAFSTPASSNCVTYSTISNGVTELAATSAPSASSTAMSSGSMSSGSASSGSASGSSMKQSATSTSGRGVAASASSLVASASSSISAGSPAFAGVSIFSVVGVLSCMVLGAAAVAL